MEKEKSVHFTSTHFARNVLLISVFADFLLAFCQRAFVRHVGSGQHLCSTYQGHSCFLLFLSPLFFVSTALRTTLLDLRILLAVSDRHQTFSNEADETLSHLCMLYVFYFWSTVFFALSSCPDLRSLRLLYLFCTGDTAGFAFAAEYQQFCWFSLFLLGWCWLDTILPSGNLFYDTYSRGLSPLQINSNAKKLAFPAGNLVSQHFLSSVSFKSGQMGSARK